jgi:hypothetical protein
VSVLKYKRKESKFEVFDYFYRTRKEITDLLLRDFGYDKTKSDARVQKYFGGRTFEELNEQEKDRYIKIQNKNIAFDDWFIVDERKTIMDCLRTITEEVFVANSIYPSMPEELVERRIHQDRAIGECHRLLQELQYAIEVLPVDINKYTHFADMVNHEIDLIKGWRKSDNKFKGNF